MAGTEIIVEGLSGFRASTLRAADSSVVNSLEGGFQVSTLQNGAIAFVVDQNGEYRWYANSLAVPADPTVVIPLGQSTLVPGRWILVPNGGGDTVVPMTQVRYVDAGTTVADPNGSEAFPFPTIAEALASFSVGVDVTCTGQFQIINGQVLGDVVAVSVIAENTLFVPFSGPETLTLTGSATFRSCQCLTPIVHTDSGNFVFVDTEVGNGTFLTTESIDVQMFGCKFGAAPVVSFSASPGVLLLDSVSNYFWTASGGSVVNGSVVVAA